MIEIFNRENGKDLRQERKSSSAITIRKHIVYLSRKLEKDCNAVKGKYITFLKDNDKWYFIINNNDKGYLITIYSVGVAIACTPFIRQLKSLNNKIKDGSKFYVHKSDRQYEGCNMFEILINKTIQQIKKNI